MVEECRSCSSIHFLSFSPLYSRENEQRKRERAVRTEHQCTLPLSSLTTSTGGLGLLWMWGEIFQRAAGVELGPGFLAGLRPCFREMKHTWFPAFPLIRRAFVADATGTAWLICSLFNDRLIVAGNILQAHLYLAKPSRADLLFLNGLCSFFNFREAFRVYSYRLFSDARRSNLCLWFFDQILSSLKVASFGFTHSLINVDRCWTARSICLIVHHPCCILILQSTDVNLSLPLSLFHAFLISLLDAGKSYWYSEVVRCPQNGPISAHCENCTGGSPLASNRYLSDIHF